MTRTEREKALLKELKEANNNTMTVMENHIMQMARCDRHTANLIANEVLDLDRESEYVLSTEGKKELTCSDCPYHYYDEGDKYPSCHHNGDDVAPCEYEEPQECYEEDYFYEEEYSYVDRNYNRLYND